MTKAEIIKDLQNKGSEILSKDKIDSWNQFVEKSVKKGWYDGEECLIAIGYIKILDSNPELEISCIDEWLAKREDLSGSMTDTISTLFKNFSARGEEYTKYCKEKDDKSL